MLRSRVRSMLAAAVVGAILLATLGGASSASAARTISAVYTLSNAPTGNAVLVWQRASDGTLTSAGSYPTGGLGTGGGLGSQGALVLSDNGRWLFAVDAGSNEISSFRVDRAGLTLTGHVASGGILPTSLTVSDDLLYVLNAGDAGNITGFRIKDDGALQPIAESTRPLSGNATAPAQVSFSPDGDLLIVTERATNQIDIYKVRSGGRVTGPRVFPSSGATPFGFAFGKRGSLIVSEANGAPGASAASSYRLDDDELELVSGSVSTTQGAACWVVVTRNGRYAYTANAGSGSISGFRIARDGTLTLLNADGRTGVTGDGSGPTDLALSHNSQFLYVRNGRNNTIGAFAVASDGSLQPIAGAEGLPAGTAGLAAW
ncbi:MAG: beta-propeller fold lactonase family protein [Chloroflexales bacterium]|nr:beta-propeller fold lactonase family protein [Chloroflexales bacterium]